MKKRGLLIIFIVLLALALMVSISACGKKADEGTQGQTTDNEKQQPTKVLKVGVIHPLSGPGALWGEELTRDADIYADMINQDGGLKIGNDYYKIEMYYADDNDMSPDKDVVAARDLIDNKGVSAIVGYWGASLPSLANVTTPQKIVLITTKPVEYNPQTMPYVAVSHTDDAIIVPQLTTVLKHFAGTKVLGISGVDLSKASMTTGLKEVQDKLLSQFGISKMVQEFYSVTTTDFTQHVEKLRSQGVDTIYSWGFPSSEAAIEKTIFQLGLKDKMRFAGSGTLVDPKDYIDVTGYDAAQGNLHGFQAPWELKESKVAPAMVDMANRMREAYKAKYNKELLYAGAFDYTCGGMALYFEALQKAGTTDPDAVMKAIDGGTFDLFIGTFTMSGKQTYGRAVFAGTTGGMGAVEGYEPKLVGEAPLTNIP